MSQHTQKQQIPTKKQHLIVVKVVIAMTLFLLGIPFLMFLATTYYTHKGLVMDVYLMGQEYTEQVNQFYKENNICPTNQNIEATITEQDIAESISFESSTPQNTCTIKLSFKSLKGTFTDKVIILSKTFNKDITTNTPWHCYSNIRSLYLPENCSATKLQDIQAKE